MEMLETDRLIMREWNINDSEDGWELCSFERGIAYFKRELVSQ
ncbi:hypothetical protein [uncultured Clostridium sp.]|nr:hypothetical protein [uncultured Clostridium sp.]